MTNKVSAILLLLVFSVFNTQAKTSVGWIYQCNEKARCSIFSYSNLKDNSSSSPKLNVYVLSFNRNGSIRIEELWDTNFHRKSFTYPLPVVLKINNINLVRNEYSGIIHEKYPIKIKFGDDVIVADNCSLKYCEYRKKRKINKIIAALKASQDLTIVRAMRESMESELIDQELFKIKPNNFFPLLVKLYSKPEPKINIKQLSANESLNLIASYISTNKLDVNVNDLAVKTNEKGIGYFVYSTRTILNGFKRNIIWFVADNKAMKLNAPTNLVTPTIPWPRDVIFEEDNNGRSLWEKTGFSRLDSTQEALEQVYGIKR